MKRRTSGDSRTGGVESRWARMDRRFVEGGWPWKSRLILGAITAVLAAVAYLAKW